VPLRPFWPLERMFYCSHTFFSVFSDIVLFCVSKINWWWWWWWSGSNFQHILPNKNCTTDTHDFIICAMLCYMQNITFNIRQQISVTICALYAECNKQPSAMKQIKSTEKENDRLDEWQANLTSSDWVGTKPCSHHCQQTSACANVKYMCLPACYMQATNCLTQCLVILLILYDSRMHLSDTAQQLKGYML